MAIGPRLYVVETCDLKGTGYHACGFSNDLEGIRLEEQCCFSAVLARSAALSSAVVFMKIKAYDSRMFC